MSLSYLGIRNELTRFLDEYINEDDKLEEYHIYIMQHNGIPDSYETSDEYGWFIRYPGYTCANIIFDKTTKCVKDFFITERDNNLGTIFRIPSLELRRLVLSKFKDKIINE